MDAALLPRVPDGGGVAALFFDDDRSFEQRVIERTGGFGRDVDAVYHAADAQKSGFGFLCDGFRKSTGNVVLELK